MPHIPSWVGPIHLFFQIPPMIPTLKLLSSPLAVPHVLFLQIVIAIAPKRGNAMNVTPASIKIQYIILRRSTAHLIHPIEWLLSGRSTFKLTYICTGLFICGHYEKPCFMLFRWEVCWHRTKTWNWGELASYMMDSADGRAGEERSLPRRSLPVIASRGKWPAMRGWSSGGGGGVAQDCYVMHGY